jgi:hypothetical protein
LHALQRAQDPQIPKIREVRDDVPASLAAVLDKGLALAPEDRFQNAGEMAAALRKVCDALGGGGPVALASWLRNRFTRIRDAQTRVLSHVGPESRQPSVDVEASTVRGVPIRPYDRSDANEVSGDDAPREGTEVFYSVDIDVELPERFDQTMPYAPLPASATSTDAESFGTAPTEVDDRPGFDLEELWVAFGTEAGDSDADPEIPVEDEKAEAERTPESAKSESAPGGSRPTDSPPPPAHPARSSGLVVGAAVIIGAAIVGAAIYLGPLNQPATGRIEIDAQIDEPFQVTVDGTRTGPVIGGLEPGEHEVTVSAQGYEVLVRAVDVTPGATTIVAAALRPLSPPPVEEMAPPPEEEAQPDASVDAAPEVEEVTPTPEREPEPPPRRRRRPRMDMTATEAGMPRVEDAAQASPSPTAGEMRPSTPPAALMPNEPDEAE